MSSLNRLILCALSLIFGTTILSGCGTERQSVQIDYGSLIENDFKICGYLPPQMPHCVTSSLNEDGFSNQALFDVCSRSMENYFFALNQHLICKREEAEKHFDVMAESLRDFANCMKNEAEINNLAYEETTCGNGFKFDDPLVSSFNLMIYYDIPYCVKDQKKWGRSPKNNPLCIDDVVEFLEDEAISNMEEGLLQIRAGIDLQRSEAVEKFNCRAEARGFCR